MDGLALLARHLGVAQCTGCGRRAGLLCDECRRHAPVVDYTKPVPHVDRVLPALAYEEHARSLVLALKLRARRTAAEPLIAAMSDSIRLHGLRAHAIAWVPGRPSDRRRRGFDHAEVLARGVARRIGLPAVRTLRRVASPPDQAGLSASARRTNLRGAFRAVDPPARVAIVDDLVTTGATLGECAAELRAAGAVGVEGVVACLKP